MERPKSARYHAAMTSAETVTAFVTLFVVVDPIGLAPLFIALTRGMTARARLKVGLRALIIAAILLTLFGLFGDKLLAGIGISMPAFRIAGGVLLFLTALDMLFERRTERRVVVMNMILQGISMMARKRSPGLMRETLKCFVAHYHDELRGEAAQRTGRPLLTVWRRRP